jgi:hypothetical protein
MTSALENDEAFETVCALLKNHVKGSDTLEQTLNRLFKKHLARKPSIASNPPTLSTTNVQVTQKHGKKLSFVGLARHLETGGAHDSDNPIIIIRYRGVDCLIDGSHRCRHWYKIEDTGDHTAYVLEVREAGI